MFSPQFVAQCVEGTCAEKSQRNPWITSMYICKSEVLPRYKRYSKPSRSDDVPHLKILHYSQKRGLIRWKCKHDPWPPLWGWNACGSTILFQWPPQMCQKMDENHVEKPTKKPPTIWISKLKALLVTRIKALLFLWDVAKPWQIYWCLANWQKKQSVTIQSSRQERPHPIRHSANQHILFAPFDFAPGCLAVGGLHTSARLDKSLSRSYLYQVNEWPKWRFLFIGRNWKHFSRGTLDGRNPAPVDR